MTRGAERHVAALAARPAAILAELQPGAQNGAAIRYDRLEEVAGPACQAK